MTIAQENLMADLRSVLRQLLELEPSHSWVPGLHRRFDGIVKDLYRTGMTRDDIDNAI